MSFHGHREVEILSSWSFWVEVHPVWRSVINSHVMSQRLLVQCRKTYFHHQRNEKLAPWEGLLLLVLIVKYLIIFFYRQRIGMLSHAKWWAALWASCSVIGSWVVYRIARILCSAAAHSAMTRPDVLRRRDRSNSRTFELCLKGSIFSWQLDSYSLLRAELSYKMSLSYRHGKSLSKHDNIRISSERRKSPC